MRQSSHQQALPILATATIAVGLIAYLVLVNGRMAALFVVGLMIGVTLYHSGFGFSAAYRRLLLHGELRAIRAQLSMVAVATLLFAPLLAAGEFAGRPLSGAAAPFGLAMLFGAFLFGIGMQLGGACGSGSLYALGAGSPRMLIVVTAFCAGGFRASLDLGAWQSLPEWPPLLLGERFGWGVTACLQAFLLGAAAWLLPCDDAARAGTWHLWRGPWPLLVGGLLLALFNLATLLLAGHPWTITWAFTLWGAKAARALGWNPVADAFWSQPFQLAALDNGVLSDVTSTMDIGLVLGATIAALLARRFALVWRMSARSFAAALLGGLVMGYGARLAYGCNIGAFFSGVASTSLHGWLWIVAALLGSSIGVRLRPLFGLAND
ncbi:YeeE/YedE family protein [Candidatus Accumulibacter sp. ACC003]|uniref:YeeE/YedE family protein n=1 Tax=Candidatus Accumulibacter sp. ACC003 TaxID=2823334 RepID=UPI0025C3C003|nr:YeeE/YedE family protein [Candidatus Accumulibacter sp. ACC003]